MLIAIPFVVAILYLPGYLGFRIISQRPSMALPLAPIISIALYVVLGNVYSMLGLRSSVVSIYVIPTALLALVFVLRRRNESAGSRKCTIPVAVLFVTAICGLAAGAYIFVLQLPRTDAIFQGWDNITHLNLIRSFVDSGDWSSLHTSSYLAPADSAIQPVPQGGFYPAGWHEVCALAVLMSGATVAKVVNATNFLFASLVYPLGVVSALRMVFGRNNKILYSGAIVSVGFAQFPWVMLNFGPIFPNLAAFCLIPACFACVLQSINGLFEKRNVFRAVFVILVVLIAAGFLQPNAVFFLAIPVFFYLGHRIYAYRRSYRIFGRQVSSTVCMNVFYLVCLILWIAIYNSPIVTPLLAYRWESYANGWQAIINILTVGYGYGFGQNTPAQLVLALMVMIGIISALKKSKQQWLVQTYVLVCIMCFVDAATDVTLKFVLCAIWYVDPTRVASMCAIAAVPLASLGLASTITFFQHRLVTGQQGSAFTVRTVPVGVAVCFIVLNFARYAGIPGWENAGIKDAYASYDESLQYYYGLSSPVAALTQEEQDFVDEAMTYVDNDSVVINNPVDGSILLYGVDGMRCYYRTSGGYGDQETAESKLIRTDLKDIATNPDVKEAVNNVGARYVLLLNADSRSMNFLKIMSDQSDSFSGITGINDATPGFKVVLQQGSMRVYEIEQ